MMLRGPRSVRVFPDMEVRRACRAPRPRVRLLAASATSRGAVVLSGHSAAPLVPADLLTEEDAPAELTVPGGGQREHLASRPLRPASPGPTCSVPRCRGHRSVRTAYDPGGGPISPRPCVGIDARANVRASTPPTCLALVLAAIGSARVPRTAPRGRSGRPTGGFADGERLRRISCRGHRLQEAPPVARRVAAPRAVLGYPTADVRSARVGRAAPPPAARRRHRSRCGLAELAGSGRGGSTPSQDGPPAGQRSARVDV